MRFDADIAIARSLARLPSPEAERVLDALQDAAEREYRAERARWIDAFTMHAGRLMPGPEPQQLATRAAALFDSEGYLDPALAAARYR